MDSLFGSIFETLIHTSSMVISDHLLNVDDDSKLANNRWSLLPDNILDMIKDKLDIFDTASVNCVCRNWWFASKYYPERHTVGDGIPWILQPSVNASGNIEVISIPRGRKIMLEVPEFCKANILFSKQGWLLMCLKKISQSSKTSHYLLLMNPITGEIIKLPKTVIASSHEYENDASVLPASFSIYNGRPHVVVLYECDYDCALSLKVVQVGDKMWRNYSYTCEIEIYVELLIAILVIDEEIYCCYLFGDMIVYNVNSETWKEVVEGPEHMFEARNYYIEYEGQVVKYEDIDGPVSDGKGLYLFNNSDNTWRKLNNDLRNAKNIDLDKVLRGFMCARRDCFLVLTDSSDEDDDVSTELPFSPKVLRRANIVPFPIYDTMTWVDIG